MALPKIETSKRSKTMSTDKEFRIRDGNVVEFHTFNGWKVVKRVSYSLGSPATGIFTENGPRGNRERVWYVPDTKAQTCEEYLSRVD